MEVKIENSWKTRLSAEFEKEYFKKLSDFVSDSYKTSTVFPPAGKIFEALNLCPFDQVKVVILGQDPYHGAGQANGLSFAVSGKTKIPPSLQNIFKEIEQEYGETINNKDGDLTRFSEQGVFLLNATLTVCAGAPGSHQGRGWEKFTDTVIKVISEERRGVVFMLWGNYAKRKGQFIDRDNHLILESAHPSPFSAYSGFFGCGHFKKANEYLVANGKEPIDWMG